MTHPPADARSGLPPLEPESPRYYGWLMVPVASLMVVATLPGQTVVVSQFNTAIRDALGIGLEAISGAYFVGTILGSVPLTLVGRLSDRLGPRLTTALVIGGFVMGMMLLANARDIATLTLAFFLVRFLGQGALGMLSSHVLALWFERRLATVESIKHGCLSLAGAAVPGAIVLGIQSVGWRETYALMAVAVAAVILPLVATVFRDRPEHVGQHLDNEPPGSHEAWRASKRRLEPIERDRVFTLGQTLATRVFWLILPASVLSGLVGTALLFHIQPMIQSVTEGDGVAGGAFAVQAWSVMMFAGLLIGGVLADRLPPRTLIPVAAIGCGLSSVMMMLMTQPWHAAASLGVFGLAQGIGMAASGPTIARYFGRPHHGAIRGFVTTVMVAGTAVGPLLLAWAARLAGGDFGPGLIGFAVASVPIAIGAAFITKPSIPASEQR